MHVDRAIARAGEAIAEAEEGALGLADQLGEGFDLGDREIADLRRPFRRAGFQMGFEFARASVYFSR